MRNLRRLRSASLLLCLALLLMGAPWPPNMVFPQAVNAQVGCPPDLIVFDPEVLGCRVWINGVVTSSCGDEVERINWEWGDGRDNDSWFPARHKYAAPGIYDVTVTALTFAGNTATETKRAYVTSCVPPEPDYYALIVGVADYPDPISDLQFTDDDALDIRSGLLRYINWEDANIQLLLDSGATKSNIQAALEQIGTMAHGDDVVLFFFSGHGTNGSDIAPLDEADGVDEYLCAYGSSSSEFIRDDELSEWLGNIPTPNVTVILDTCFAGGEIKAPGAAIKSLPGTPVGLVKRGDGFAPDLISRIRPMDMDDNAGCVVLTSSAEDELSYELAFLSNGLFSFFAVRGLERNLDLDGNGELAAEELFVYPWLGVRWFETRFGIPQHPQLHDSYPAGDPSSARLGVGLGVPLRSSTLDDEASAADSEIGRVVDRESWLW